MPRSFNDKTLKEVIQDMLRSTGMDRRYTELDVEEVYRRYVGEYITRKTRSARMREKTLYLRIDSSPVKEELLFRKTQLLAHINEHFGRVVVEDIHIS